MKLYTFLTTDGQPLMPLLEKHNLVDGDPLSQVFSPEELEMFSTMATFTVANSENSAKAVITPQEGVVEFYGDDEDWTEGNTGKFATIVRRLTCAANPLMYKSSVTNI